jgi:hypothetical protein
MPKKVPYRVILSEAKNLSVHGTYTEERFFASLRMTTGVFPQPVQPVGVGVSEGTTNEANTNKRSLQQQTTHPRSNEPGKH